jgi:predicted glycogen debranching enzyme
VIGVESVGATPAPPPAQATRSRRRGAGRLSDGDGLSPLDFGREALGDIERASRLEWLETDGLGGWSSGTVAGAHTRRYHGWLVTATKPPVGRRVLISKLAETVRIGERRVELDANFYPATVHPRGFDRLAGFERGVFPVFEFRFEGEGEHEGEDFLLKRTMASLAGESTAVVVYELGSAARPVELELVALLAGRDAHALERAADARRWDPVPMGGGVVRFDSRRGEPSVYVSVARSRFKAVGEWHWNVEYPEERARGFDFQEDLYAAGRFTVALAPGERLAVVLSTADPSGRVGESLLADERSRRLGLLERSGVSDPFGRRLVLAADQFLVRRGEGWTVVAGYPWFADWGRDAMIALPGLCLATGRFEEARGILRSFVAALDRGMLPNRFPDDGAAPEYNTVDATLWLFVAAWRYLEATGDEAFVRDQLLPALDDVLAWHGKGTRHGIGIDGDGLLRSGEDGVQLTWMDARVNGRVITPRRGKPVEISALWVNALRITAALHARFGRSTRARVLDGLADTATARFEELYWNEPEKGLDDVVDRATYDASRRPNQLYALALPWPLLAEDKARTVLATVDEHLLTPAGLRTLDPEHPDFRGRYEGGPAARDGAYHQGTVWPFLLGVWADATLRSGGARGRARVRRHLAAFARHLGEAAVGSVSEICDGEAPHVPRGAFAQAWSVGELLRAWRSVAE